MSPRADAGALRISTAVALGLLQGPAELLPVSSSAHLSVVPWLAGWDYGSADPELRKAFEVTVHGACALALILAMRADVLAGMRSLRSPRRLGVVAAATAVPALAGYALERPIEQRLGGPAATAAGLAAGAIALALADLRPAGRGWDEASAADGWWLGVAQACALVPGVSRSGATVTAARLRGFGRADAARLSRDVALPVIAGASGLKAVRLAQRGGGRGVGLGGRVVGGAGGDGGDVTVAALTAGAGAAFLSTLACAPLARWTERGRPLWPFAAYRLGLAGAIALRLRRGS